MRRYLGRFLEFIQDIGLSIDSVRTLNQSKLFYICCLLFTVTNNFFWFIDMRIPHGEIGNLYDFLYQLKHLRVRKLEIINAIYVARVTNTSLQYQK